MKIELRPMWEGVNNRYYVINAETEECMGTVRFCALANKIQFIPREYKKYSAEELYCIARVVDEKAKELGC